MIASPVNWLVWTNTLAAAVQFNDVFTGMPVRTAFNVSIPDLRWAALRWDPDATYRFSMVNAPIAGGLPQLPTGTFTLALTSADPTYAALEPRQITLPPAPAHPPPVLASDYLTPLVLWPTVAFHPPPGETAVLARLVSASNQDVTGLKVRMFDSAAPPPPASVYTRTDSAGQFLVRLPGVQRPNTPNPTASLQVQVFDAANVALAVTPPNVTAPIGQTSGFVTLSIP